MPRWIKRIIIRFGWPIVKKKALDFINNEELQKRLVEKLEVKKDIPLADKDVEKKFNEIIQHSANDIYILMREVLTEYIDEVNINEIVDKIYGKKRK